LSYDIKKYALAPFEGGSRVFRGGGCWGMQMKKLENAWSTNAPWLILLKPISWIYGAANKLHRLLYEKGILKQTSFNVPVIVVGNIMAGGTGKTPTVIALAKQYQASGKNVGIISRGYGATAAHYPVQVKQGDNPAQVGDEPLLILEKTNAMVVCDPDRVRGIQYLINAGCDLIISDDGLQHYRLKPSMCIVVHPKHWMGSTDVLPAGPMREPLSRLQAFDKVLYIDDSMRKFECKDREGRAVEFSALPEHLNVVVGIAQPKRLFDFLDGLSIKYTRFVFPDHYAFTPADFATIDGPILMTSKDWVKCRGFSLKQKIYVIDYFMDVSIEAYMQSQKTV
jgi:tetraacyldisaccharide 4'-kinase